MAAHVMPVYCESARILDQTIGKIVELIPPNFRGKVEFVRVLRGKQVSAHYTPSNAIRDRWDETARLLNDRLPDTGGAWITDVAVLFWTTYEAITS